MAEPDNLVLTLLRELRQSMDTRFDQQGRTLEAIRQALKSETILGRYTVNGVEDRLDELEKRVSAIEAQR